LGLAVCWVRDGEERNLRRRHRRQGHVQAVGL